MLIYTWQDIFTGVFFSLLMIGVVAYLIFILVKDWWRKMRGR